jgi:hypothetical protein
MFLKRFIFQKVFIACTSTNHKIVPLKNLNKYLHSDTSETTVGRFYTFTGHEGFKGEYRYSAILFLDLGTRTGWGVSVTPLPLSSAEKNPAPIVQETGWAPGLVWTCAEISPPPGFDPRTVQSEVYLYTVWATRPRKLKEYAYKYRNI